MKSKVFVFTHKPTEYQLPCDNIYTPMEVGAYYHSVPIAELRDNCIADNLSEFNPLYAEMTGTYAIWKSLGTNKPLVADDVTHIGQCHYRRILPVPQDLESDEAVVPFPTYVGNIGLHYGRCHSELILDYFGQTIAQEYPEEYEDWKKFLHTAKLYANNSFLLPRAYYSEYCSKFFNLCQKFRERHKITSVEESGWWTRDLIRRKLCSPFNNNRPDRFYQGQHFGFLGERYFAFYIQRCGLKLKEVNLELKEPVNN